MEPQDFSHNFDLLLNSYATNGKFGDTMPDIRLDEYEKSQFLTKAQEEEVLSLYTGQNATGEGFEETERLRRYLSNLVVDAERTPIVTSNGKPLGFDSKHTFFTLPDNPPVWFITYESVDVDKGEGKCGGTATMEVYPTKQDEYHKLRKNPFRGANNRRALRFDLSEGNIEIVCKYPVTRYYLRYLKRPNPIVLEDFSADGLTINGENSPTPCELHEALHQRILERAVALALQAKSIGRVAEARQ